MQRVPDKCPQLFDRRLSDTLHRSETALGSSLGNWPKAISLTGLQAQCEGHDCHQKPVPLFGTFRDGRFISNGKGRKS